MIIIPGTITGNEPTVVCVVAVDKKLERTPVILGGGTRRKTSALLFSSSSRGDAATRATILNLHRSRGFGASTATSNIETSFDTCFTDNAINIITHNPMVLERSYKVVLKRQFHIEKVNTWNYNEEMC